MTDNVKNHGVIGRALPGIHQDNTQAAQRFSRYGENYAQLIGGASAHAMADEGSYFIATNPTMGTGIAGIAASTSYDAAESLLLLRNTSTTKRLYLHFIDLVVTAAGANGTTTGFTMTSDKGNTRYSSGGSTITSIVNPNLASTETAEVQMYFGALVTAAASTSARLLGDFLVRNVIKVVGDSYRFTFGEGNWAIAGDALSGTNPVKVNVPCPPVVLGENDQFLLHDWGASQSGASSYQFRVGFWMR